MNYQQLANLTVSYLDDLNFGYFTQAQVNVWLNNAQRKVQRILIDLKQNYYAKCVQTLTATNQCNYVLPDDFMMAHRVEVVIYGSFPNEVKNAVIPITLMQQDLLSAVPAIPEAYYFKRNSLCFAPIPDQVYTIRLTYSYQVADMINSYDVPDVPERYHELLAMYAALDGFIKDDRENAYLMGLVEKYEEKMKAEAQERQEQAAREVVSMREDMWGTIF